MLKVIFHLLVFAVFGINFVNAAIKCFECTVDNNAGSFDTENCLIPVVGTTKVSDSKCIRCYTNITYIGHYRKFGDIFV
jgi:hypothetical protein